MKKETLAIFQMLLCALFWSLSGVLTRLTPWDAYAIMAGRSFFAALVIFAYMRFTKQKVAVSKKTLFLGASVVIIFLLYLPAVQLTSVGNAIVLQYTAPIYVLLFSVLFFKQKVKRGDVIAVIITFLGVALCCLDRLGGGSMAGNFLALGSGIFLGIMFLMGGHINETERLSGLLFGQIFSVIIGAPFFLTTNPLINGPIIFYILVHGILQLGVAYVLYARATRYCNPLMSSLISVLEPLLNPIWAWLVVGEALSLYSIAGSLVVLATITVWCIWGEKQKQKQALMEQGNMHLAEQE